MKLISKAVILFVMVFNLLSCSKDDDQVTFEGKWELYKQGYFNETPETEKGYVLYPHLCETKKDTRTFMTNGTMLQEFYNSECDDTSRTFQWAWKEKGKKITYMYGDRGENYEILELNQTTLKLKYLGSDGIWNKQFEDKPTHIIYKRVK